MTQSSIKTGFSFGITSGTITTLGLIIGLHSGIGSKIAIIGGILTIAIADAFSDALGIHITEEAKKTSSSKDIWQATIATFLSKAVFASTFILPTVLFEISTAITISIIWGLLLIGVFSYYIGKERENRPWHAVSEHLLIAVVVIITTHFIGDFIKNAFE